MQIFYTHRCAPDGPLRKIMYLPINDIITAAAFGVEISADGTPEIYIDHHGLFAILAQPYEEKPANLPARGNELVEDVPGEQTS
jgi:hypothetical protein